MFKNLILASATAAVALTAAADFSAGTFDITAGAAAQTVKPSKPSLQPMPTVDLHVEPHFPKTYEGTPGHFYCSQLHGGLALSKAVMFKVINDGNTPAGPIKVVVEFKGAKTITRQVNSSVANGAGSAVSVDIPATAWKSGTASFTIRVDHPNKVAETNEHNNVVKSFCAGPQG